jgi:hypothetical protein
MPKEIDRPIGEKSPNLATLVRRSFFFSFWREKRKMTIFASLKSCTFFDLLIKKLSMLCVGHFFNLYTNAITYLYV